MYDYAGLTPSGPRPVLSDAIGRVATGTHRKLLRDPVAKPSALDKLVRSRQPDVVDAAGWKAIDAAEIARGGEHRPREKFTSVADMLAAAAAAPAPPVRQRLLAGLLR